jgi:hypothetical protein
MQRPVLRLHHGGTDALGRVLRDARGSIRSAIGRALVRAHVHALVQALDCALIRVLSRALIRVLIRALACVCPSALLVAVTLCVAACGATPAEPVPFKAVPADRIVKPGYTEPASSKVAVDLRRERTDDVVVRFRDALVYVDGEQVADLMNGEHIVFYLTPGLHRLAVSTQFDPVRELQFIVTADPRYTNRARITFDASHRIVLMRVAQ